MNPKKIFLLQEIIPNYRVPVFRRIGQLAGVDLTVYYSRPTGKQEGEGLKNASDLSGFRAKRIGVWEIGGIGYRFAFVLEVLRWRPDVVILGGGGANADVLVALLVSRLLGSRVLWFLGGTPYIALSQISAEMQSSRLTRWFGRYNPRRWLMFCAHGMIVYSNHAKGYYANQGFPRARIWVAPNSPDTDSLRKYEVEIRKERRVIEELRKSYAPVGGKVILMLGRLNSARNTDVLLDAFKMLTRNLPDTALVLVGDGPERVRLQGRVAAENIAHVEFAGAIYDDAILAKYYLASDLFVTPGVASLAIKIAMAYGIPVIAADYGLEVHTIRDGENGMIVPINDVKALAATIEIMLRDDDLRRRIGAEGRRTVEEDVNIQNMVDGFRKAIFAE